MIKPLGIEYIRSIAEKNGFRLLSEEYKNRNTIIHLVDNEGYMYSPTAGGFLINIERCKKLLIFFKSNIYTIQNINLWMEKNNRKSRVHSGKYTNGGEKGLSFICECGNTFECRLDEIIYMRRDSCISCSKKRRSENERLSIEEVESRFFERGIEILNSDSVIYESNKTKFKMRCMVCNFVWERETSYPNGCPECGRRSISDKNKLTMEEIRKRLSYINLEIVGEIEYKDKDTKFLVRCLKCGHVWNRQMACRESSCPACNQSKGEKRIGKFLSECSIIFSPQKRFPDCKNILPLPFDFYLPDYNVLIEYHGIQHYKPVSIFGGDVEHMKTKKRDKIKRLYCHNNMIPLLIISYENFDLVEEIITDFLNNLQEE